VAQPLAAGDVAAYPHPLAPGPIWIEHWSNAREMGAIAAANLLAEGGGDDDGCKSFAAVLSDKGAPGRAIVGSTSPNGLAKAAKSDMADFAIVTLDSMLASAKLDADWPKHAPLIARLAPETMEVIAPREIKSVADLQGKRVSVGDPDSATVTSARLLFSRFGISVAETLEPLTGLICTSCSVTMCPKAAMPLTN